VNSQGFAGYLATPGAPYGLAQTTAYKDEFNTDLLGFLKS
jgi:hypothetical protein